MFKFKKEFREITRLSVVKINGK